MGAGRQPAVGSWIHGAQCLWTVGRRRLAVRPHSTLQSIIRTRTSTLALLPFPPCSSLSARHILINHYTSCHALDSGGGKRFAGRAHAGITRDSAAELQTQQAGTEASTLQCHDGGVPTWPSSCSTRSPLKRASSPPTSTPRAAAPRPSALCARRLAQQLRGLTNYKDSSPHEVVLHALHTPRCARTPGV